jgi:pimeloyl-ACP methyl ester carboxylesterase
MEKKEATLPKEIAVCDMTGLQSWGYFFVGGKYEEDEGVNVEKIEGQTEVHVMRGHIYIEVFVPTKITRPYPVLFLPGNNQTGLSWLNTPDGRKGWAQYFWENGYLVYVADVQARGRASALLAKGQNFFVFSSQKCERVFAGKENLNATQWFGGRERGTPEFDAFYATIVPSLNDNKQMQTYMQKAGVALLNKTGPAIIVAHSQACSYGWLIADAKPEVVKGLIQLEPKGPPFHDDSERRKEKAVWGLTEIAMTYDPPAKVPSELLTKEYIPANPKFIPGLLQKEPCRILPNLREIPIMIITAAQSKHSNYDYLTAAYLKQAGVKSVTHCLLEECCILGNSHMFMLEKNNIEIARIAHQWLEEKIEG